MGREVSTSMEMYVEVKTAMEIVDWNSLMYMSECTKVQLYTLLYLQWCWTK